MPIETEATSDQPVENIDTPSRKNRMQRFLDLCDRYPLIPAIIAIDFVMCPMAAGASAITDRVPVCTTVEFSYGTTGPDPRIAPRLANDRLRNGGARFSDASDVEQAVLWELVDEGYPSSVSDMGGRRKVEIPTGTDVEICTARTTGPFGPALDRVLPPDYVAELVET